MNPAHHIAVMLTLMVPVQDTSVVMVKSLARRVRLSNVVLLVKRRTVIIKTLQECVSGIVAVREYLKILRVDIKRVVQMQAKHHIADMHKMVFV